MMSIFRSITLALAGAVSLTACNEQSHSLLTISDTATTTAQVQMANQGSAGHLIAGMYFIARQPGLPSVSGITGPDGTFSFRKGDTVTFYLDDAGTVAIAHLLMTDSTATTVFLAEHISINNAASTNDVELGKLTILLAALDEDDLATPTIQLNARVRLAARQQAAYLLDVLSGTTVLEQSAGVTALLAALDDPATTENEGKTAADLLSPEEIAAAFGLTLDTTYTTVSGDVCLTLEPIPGCTFLQSSGARITVSADPDYNQFGMGSDDMWHVVFYADGSGAVYDDLDNFQFFADVSDFHGYIEGTTIGVGTSSTNWENVAGGTYWFGDNGVLYSANTAAGNYGDAIN